MLDQPISNIAEVAIATCDVQHSKFVEAVGESVPSERQEAMFRYAADEARRAAVIKIADIKLAAQ